MPYARRVSRFRRGYRRSVTYRRRAPIRRRPIRRRVFRRRR